VLVPTVSIHDEDLVAPQLVASRLKDDPLPVWRPIRFGVLSAVGKLADFAEMGRRLRQENLPQPASRKENV
jgi:hypothetical protein